MSEPPEERPITSPPHINLSSETLDETIPWIDYAVRQARIAQRTTEDTLDSAISITTSRINRFVSTGSAHFQQTIDSLKDVKSEYVAYEDLAFDKVKEGISIAASYPFTTGTAVVGLGLLVFKRPRRFLYYGTMRLLVSEEKLLARADAKVKEFQKSIDLLKLESTKLEKAATQAEEEMKRGRTKLGQAGNQIQSLIRSAYKIERQAGGLKEVLRELPRMEASQFRSQVTKLAKEAKRERNALSKEVSKISDYGISV
ncbi:RGS1-HXK1-interacting protein 1 [Impatiens glandulifera]|uniref:RGS1-HXK1-interacting protein 1 n=1 Tax=Impatiens glandulifera TaxID=253017 RepID=UPI001FB0CC46|nr:RGS1-HXK1-interacting protein 1 [Impatiens glandulifera]